MVRMLYFGLSVYTVEDYGACSDGEVNIGMFHFAGLLGMIRRPSLLVPGGGLNADRAECGPPISQRTGGMPASTDRIPNGLNVDHCIY